MIKLGGLVNLKPIQEAEGDKYTHIGYGKYKEKGHEKDDNAPTFEKDDNGKFTPISAHAAAAKDSDGKDDKPKVNIFNKDKESSKEEPKSEPSKSKLESDPEAEKVADKISKKYGITPEKMDEEEYKVAMGRAVYSALTNSNFHTEARQLLAVLEDRPELAEKPDYPSINDPKFSEKMMAISKKYDSKYSERDDYSSALGRETSDAAEWDGEKSVGTLTKQLRKNGFGEMADKIESIFDEEDKNESVNEIKYDDALADFNKELEKNSEVKKAAKHYKKSTKDVVKALQSKIKINRYSDKSIKQVSIDYKEDGPLSSKVSIKLSKDYQQNESVNESAGCGCGCGCNGSKKESVNEGQYKTIMSNGGRNLFFTIVDDKTDKVDTIDLKKWLKTSLKDKASEDSKDKIVKAILKKEKQFNKKVDYNMWSKKGKPSFEDKINYFIKNGFVNNITSKGIKVYESKESSKLTDLLGDE